MKALPAITEGFSHWIDAVAGTAAAVFDRFDTQRTVKLVEDEDGEFVLQTDEKISAIGSTPERFRIIKGRFDHTAPATLATALSGSRVELVLQPKRFLFRPLELPGRATEFLNGIVRTQIDRLTPWSATDAAFGWSKPIESGVDQITLTVATTALALIKPYVQAIADIGAHSISVLTSLPEAGPGATLIKIWEENAQGVLDIGRVRQALVIILATASIAAGAAVGGAAIIGANLDAQQNELVRQIANARTAAGAVRAAASDSKSGVHRTLGQRKNEEPSTVMVLEALSHLLPDHTYVTELRVEGNKLRLVGVTRDAPSLIALIEQSGRFTQATFFAPTTRSPSDQGERFHIEAAIQSLAAPRS